MFLTAAIVLEVNVADWLVLTVMAVSVLEVVVEFPLSKAAAACRRSSSALC